MKKTIQVDGKELRLSSDQLSQRLLASVTKDDVPLSEIFSYELSAVAPSLFLDNGEMRKNNKSDLMNELLPKNSAQVPDPGPPIIPCR